MNPQLKIDNALEPLPVEAADLLEDMEEDMEAVVAVMNNIPSTSLDTLISELQEIDRTLSASVVEHQQPPTLVGYDPAWVLCQPELVNMW